MHFKKKLNIIDIEDYKDLKYSIEKLNNHIFLNFPESYSMKVNTEFNKLRKKDINRLIGEIESFINEKFYMDDAQYSEKVIILTYKYLIEKEYIIVETSGMAFDSIDYFIKIMKVILDKLSNKTLFIVKNFIDINESQLTDLYIHINKIEKEIIFDFMKNWLIGFKPKNEYFRYPEYFGKMEFETEDYFEMLSFILSGTNKDYDFYFKNKNNTQYPKGMILIHNNSMYLGIGVNKSYEKDFIDKLTKEYDKTPIISNWLQLPY